MQEYSFYKKEPRLYHTLFYCDDEPNVSDEEKVDGDENTQLERAIISAATHHGSERRKRGDLGDVESDGERTVQHGIALGFQ